MDREYWAPVVDKFMEDLKAFEFQGRSWDIRENIKFRNGVESIYTVQYSVNDGSGGRNGGYAEALNFPHKPGESPAGCCGFFQPTQDFVNSFRTDADGLPYLDSYNEELVSSDIGIPQARPWKTTTEYLQDDIVTLYDPVDPDTDLQYKSLRGALESPNVDNHPLSSPKKQVYKKSQEGIYTDVVPEFTRILEYEKTMPWGRSHYGFAFVGPEDVNYPIPQRILDEHQGKFVQNR